MERFSAENINGGSMPMMAMEIPVEELAEPARLLAGCESEVIACYAICADPGGQRIADALTYGYPDGIGFRLTLTGLGMCPDVWERLMPVAASIGEMVQQYWRYPVMMPVKGRVEGA